ncbi:hypothetical protein DYB25_008649 [Aphanomyces astaci]|uniref:Uncharacterized protein n=1 Tax=Aphanomyces astaci TaxID=112090 RepID=A0A397BJI8_APHAT|nr:hypothetical protein DYB25_008649 [Aphanomyces astaci]
MSPSSRFAATVALLAALCPRLGADATTAVQNKRYCEILFVTSINGSFVADVFNTFGHNDCPVALWNAITPENAKSDPNTVAVVLNGPRYWKMDEFGPLTSPIVKESVVKFVGGLNMSLVGRVVIPMPSLAPPSYSMSTVTRNADWIWRAGTMGYFLTNTTSGDSFIMQSNKATSSETSSLQSLESRFKTLPSTWTFTAMRLSEDLNITTPSLVGGAATFGVVIQDEFQNTYSYTKDVAALAARAGLLTVPSTATSAEALSMTGSLVMLVLPILVFLQLVY